MSRLVVIVLCGWSAIGGCAAGHAEPAAPTAGPPTALTPNAVVENIVDGDTIDVLAGGNTERIRLIGIDTPEIAHPAMGSRPANPTECFGDDAKTYTASLLPVGTQLRLERDVVARDDYGRLLAYVYRATDGIFVNYEIVRHGYAQPLSIAPNVGFAQLIVEATRRAETESAGLWAACRNQ